MAVIYTGRLIYALNRQTNVYIYFFIGLTDKHNKVVEKYKCK